MYLSHFRVLIHELLDKDPDIVSEETPLIVLDSKSVICMANNGKDTKRARHIARIMNFVKNGEKCNMHNMHKMHKMHKIDWCEVVLQLSDIATKNFGELNITPIMKYIMVILEH